MPHPTKPCGDCPFRRAAPAGWIGGHDTPNEITAIVMADQKFPCHMAVNQLQEEIADPFDAGAFLLAVDSAPYCVGALIMMNNTCKMSRNSFVAALQERVGKSRDVFTNAHEFNEHHSALVRKKAKKARRRVK